VELAAAAKKVSAKIMARLLEINDLPGGSEGAISLHSNA
jgi:hypothetical protein